MRLLALFFFVFNTVALFNGIHINAFVVPVLPVTTTRSRENVVGIVIGSSSRDRTDRGCRRKTSSTCSTTASLLYQRNQGRDRDQFTHDPVIMMTVAVERDEDGMSMGMDCMNNTSDIVGNTMMNRKYNVYNHNEDNDNVHDGTVAIPTSTTATTVETESSRRSFLTKATAITSTTTSFVMTSMLVSPATAAATTTTTTAYPIDSYSPLIMNRGSKMDESSTGIGNNESTDSMESVVFEYDTNGKITIPLSYTTAESQGGGELVISYSVDGSKFRAVVDTGSPFLMIPGNCGQNTRIKSGCYQNQGTSVKGLPPTIEIFDNFQGEVLWRKAYFDWNNSNNNNSNRNHKISTTTTTDNNSKSNNGNSISDDNQITTLSSSTTAVLPQNQKKQMKKQVIFGVVSESILSGPGGVFFGMIRDTDKRIRPSFLGQTDVQAFCINLRSRQSPTLTLSNRPLLVENTGIGNGSAGTTDYIPMTNILRRKYDDPVGHYTACAQSIYVNGYPLATTTRTTTEPDDVDDSNNNNKKKKPTTTTTTTTILVIFDTGVTGMVVSRSLYEEQYFLARKRKEKTLFGNVEINFTSQFGQIISLTNKKNTNTNTNNKKKKNSLSSSSSQQMIVTPFDPGETWVRYVICYVFFSLFCAPTKTSPPHF